MKNIHVLPTDNPTYLHQSTKSGILRKSSACINDMKQAIGYHIYITSDKEIKEDRCWVINSMNKKESVPHSKWGKLIILTTDQDLIKDDVQAIDDEFLEWFVKNPSCKEVEVEKFHGIKTSIAEINSFSGDGSLKWKGRSDLRDYKIIIPKEELKYPIGGYAPGYYSCTCHTCKTQFQGDKRAVQCKPCAVSTVNKNETDKTMLEQANTLEEAIKTRLSPLKENISRNLMFIQGAEFGAKWLQKRMYNEEEVLEIFHKFSTYLPLHYEFLVKEQFKKK